MIDLHVHSHHSCDSKIKIEEYCEKAVRLGLKYICFTCGRHHAQDIACMASQKKISEGSGSASEKV